MTLYIHPRNQTGCKSSWWDTHAVDIWQFHCRITPKTVCYHPYWKASAWVPLYSPHQYITIIHTTNGFNKIKICKFDVSFHSLFIDFSFYFFFYAFLTKITLGPWHGGGGGGGVHLWTWTQGQQMTYSGPKFDVQWAKMWHTRGWKVTYGPKCNIGLL